MRVVGTAGHVDHGKSSLVSALTGINPDRLKEEQQREMTIDLGFAWLTLPNGEEVGIVDVPGHRDFIENMLAGVGGIDAVLFVVAADEGVMPQTREHLAILDLLQIQAGIIVLTKIDLVGEPEWLELIELDVREAVRGTVLEKAPLVRVSSRNGSGLDELRSALAEILAKQPLRPDLGRPRLPIDRVFTIAGFGTVVTGTLSDGCLQVGEEVEILPSGLRGRIRGLQSHKRKETRAVPGSRTAVNLSGVNVDEIRRGDVLVHPGDYRSTSLLDVHFRLLSDIPQPLRHNAEAKLFLGAAEVVARVRLLGGEEIQPGDEGWLQLELKSPVVAVRGDRYILRRPSPGETLGGGVVLDPHPRNRHKRFDRAVLQTLEAMRKGSPDEVLLQALLGLGAVSLRELIQHTHLSEGDALQVIRRLIAEGKVIQLEGGEITAEADVLIVARPEWERKRQQALDELAQYHKAFPLRSGMPREELKSRLKGSQRWFNAALRCWIAEGNIRENGAQIALSEHVIRLTAQQKSTVDALLRRFADAPFSPPSVKECREVVGEELYNALVEMGELKQVSAEVVFRKTDYELLLNEVNKHFAAEKTLTVAQFRDRFQTSRRYALAFLEYLDTQGITIREGDIRRLAKR